MKKFLAFLTLFFGLTLSGCSISNNNQQSFEDQASDLQQQITNLTPGTTTQPSIVQDNIISYSLGNLQAKVDKIEKSFNLTATELTAQAKDCGSQHLIGYFDNLVKTFVGSSMTVYTFTYQADSQNDKIYTITVLPNLTHYLTLADFKKDFDQCSAGGNAYPSQISKDWLLFVSSCGTGFDDGSDRPHGCQIIKDQIDSSTKLIDKAISVDTGVVSTNYKNTQYKFELSFPETWKDFKTADRVLDFGINGKSNSIDFGFKQQDSVFNISVHSQEQWDKIQKEDGPKPVYLGKNKEYIFGISGAQYSADDFILQRIKEITEISKTFKATD